MIVAEDQDSAAEAKLRLARVGIENVAGHLAGGVAAWAASARPVATLPQITVDELHARLGEEKDLAVLDVRRPGEQAGGHVPGAQLLPLDRLPREVAGLDPKRPLAVICAGGYRSSAACSLLEGRGFRRLWNVVGGTAAWTQAGFDVRPAGLSRPVRGSSGPSPPDGRPDRWLLALFLLVAGSCSATRRLRRGWATTPTARRIRGVPARAAACPTRRYSRVLLSSPALLLPAVLLGARLLPAIKAAQLLNVPVPRAFAWCCFSCASGSARARGPRWASPGRSWARWPSAPRTFTFFRAEPLLAMLWAPGLLLALRLFGEGHRARAARPSPWASCSAR